MNGLSSSPSNSAIWVEEATGQTAAVHIILNRAATKIEETRESFLIEDDPPVNYAANNITHAQFDFISCLRYLRGIPNVDTSQ